MLTEKLKQAAAVAGLSFCGLASATTYGNTLAGATCCLIAEGNSVGQTFQTGAGTLTDWSFFAGYWVDPPPTSGNVKLVVAAWDGAKAVGPSLFTSPELAYTYNPSEGPQVLHELAFNGINTSLLAGTYIAYLTTFGVGNPADWLSYGISAQDGGLNGNLRSSTSIGVDPLTVSTDWQPPLGAPPISMLYSATIVTAPVPEPEGLVMMLAGLGLLATWMQRKTRS